MVVAIYTCTEAELSDALDGVGVATASKLVALRDNALKSGRQLTTADLALWSSMIKEDRWNEFLAQGLLSLEMPTNTEPVVFTQTRERYEIQEEVNAHLYGYIDKIRYEMGDSYLVYQTGYRRWKLAMPALQGQQRLR